jgi:PPOX class probable F420-dependent enzyme
MAAPTIPDSHKVLFEKPIIASLATLMPNGLIQVNPVWVDYDGTHVRFNSAEGRQKDKNLKKNGVVTLLLVDTEDVYFWIEVRGRVSEITPEGADAHIDSLAKKYLGKDKYPNRREGEVRLTYIVQPERVRAVGPSK